MYKRIMVAVDESFMTSQVMRAAVELAKASGAHLAICHAIDETILAQRELAMMLPNSVGKTEARLRLGRVLWRLQKADEARACFDKILSKAGEAPVQYLAHLFLGRVLEDKGEWSGAEEHYRIALSIEPASGTAAVALSQVRFLQGDHASAREILVAGIEAARHRTDFDPWVPYLITQAPVGEQILAGLRQGLRP